MQRTEPTPAYIPRTPVVAESSHSAVSWGAVIAGAVIGAALSAMLITGGTGLGFLAVSPWQNDGASGGALATGTIVWLLLTHIIAYGVAGYVAGRLRTRWTDARGDEVYFRDTAHGLLVWALSFVVSLILLGSAAASIISGTAKTGATLVGAGAGAAAMTAGQAADGEEGSFSMDYFADMLLRPADTAQAGDPANVRGEVSRILTRSLAHGEISPDDQTYVARIIAQRAGISETEAQQRLTQIRTQAQEAAEELEQKTREVADEARKAAAIFALWAFASMLLGAFVASFAATRGGRARDL